MYRYLCVIVDSKRLMKRSSCCVRAGEPQEECARCGKTFLMLVGGNGGGSQVGSDVTGLCNDCLGSTDNDKEEDSEGGSDVSISGDGDGDVDVDNDNDNDQDS